MFIGDFSTKLRTNTQLGFIRLAEEQFSSNWFDVRLIRSPELKLDLLGNDKSMAGFGALIIQQYKYQNIQNAYELLRRFAQMRPVILFPTDAELFHLIRGTISRFPHAYILDRALPEVGFAMNSDYGPTYSFANSPIRQQWRQIREILDKEKTPVWTDSQPPTITALEYTNSIHLDSSVTKGSSSFPVLLRRSYHPRWVAPEGAQLFATTPFFTVAYIRGSETLRFERNLLDRSALILSCTAAIAMALCCFLPAARQKRKTSERVRDEEKESLIVSG